MGVKTKLLNINCEKHPTGNASVYTTKLYTAKDRHNIIDLIFKKGSDQKMTYFSSWEEFEKAAERLYLADSLKCRFVTKYRHCDGKLSLKVTDDKVCLQYRTEHAQDIKRLEKLTGHLMRHMASKEK